MSLIYIGNLTDIDTDESDFDAEDPNAILGTYSAFGGMLPVSVNNHDVNADGTISDDEGWTGDYVTYTIDGVAYSPEVDTSAIYSAEVTELNGTKSTTNLVVFQMTNGDTFLGELGGSGLSNKEVREVELLSHVGSDYSGYSSDFSISNVAVCFQEGTRLQTLCGEVPVENLGPGAFLKTRDNGYQAVRWIGGFFLERAGKQAPVHIAKGALGCGLPRRDLSVSPQHRILICSKVALRMFGTKEVFLPAFRLVGLPGIERGSAQAPVTYWHVLCKGHEVVEANGAPTETLYPGRMAQTVAFNALEADLLAMVDTTEPIAPARFIPDPPQQKRLVARLDQNRKSPLETFL